MENEEMKERIAHIIRAKNMTAAEFAIKLGIQPSNVSHLLSGRNNPSLDFVRKLKETFPEYNLEWIIFGQGPMTVSEPFAASTSVVESESTLEERKPDGLDAALFSTLGTTDLPVEPTTAKKESSLKKMILVYDDNTFEVLLPR